MVEPVPAEFHLVPTSGTRCTGGRIEGGRPPVVVELGPGVEAVVTALLDGCAVGSAPAGGAHAGAVARRLLELDLATPRPPSTDGTRHSGRVAGIIPAHQAAGSVSAAIAALAHADEVIVVDDGSTDDTAAVAAAAGARVVRRPTAGGPAAARNHGAASTDAEILVFLDADTDADPAWLGPLLAQLADLGAGGAAPRVTAARGDSVVASYERASSGLDLGAVPGLVRPDGRIPFVSTTALVVRHTVFDELGGFSEDLRFGEDVDLVWRLAASGRPVVYEPSACVRHHHRPSVGSQVRNQFRYATASGPLEARHGLPRSAGAHPLVSAGTIVAVLGARKTGLALAAAGTADLRRQLVAAGFPPAGATRSATRTALGWVRGLAAALSRPWLPLAVALALARRRSRLPVAAAVAGRWASLAARRGSHERTGAWLAMRALEDAAHSVGAIVSCVRVRRVSSLLPATAPEPSVVSSVLGREVHLP